MKNFVEEMKWRGMLHDVMLGTEEMLNKGMTNGYIGFDPTSDSLGVGNLVQIMTLLHFQKAGHKPIALIGGATGMIGDPSGKSAERNLLNEDILSHNVACQKKQLEKFLDFDCGVNSAELVNNYDWFKEISFIDFIRDVGKHIPINYMLVKESVKNRLETGMSFTEFTYQLVQGYDYYYLYQNKNCKIQMGGSDQWGNILTGIELLRKKSGVNDAFALTTPLIKKADGTKFGKTESGNVWLDAKKTSPYKFYQFWLNSSDADVSTYIKIFSLKTREEIEALEKEHKQTPHLRVLQKALAEEITIRVHSVEDYNMAVDASNILFGNSTSKSFETMNEKTFLDVFEGVSQFKISKNDIENGIGFVELLTEQTQIFPYKGVARKMISAGGVSINKEKNMDVEIKINAAHLINNKYIIVQKGKKNHFLIIVE